jgi:hypothetical protein
MPASYRRKVLITQPQLQPIPAYNRTQSLRNDVQDAARQSAEPSEERGHSDARIDVTTRSRRRCENEQRESCGVQQRGVQTDSHRRGTQSGKSGSSSAESKD